ncbi:transmembrane protein 223 [Onychostruthus taczanowskii]|uniref:transmembrane protein 223 n=1 Tax=Onychostruthus taczanowskii TaxID=356909 RepID=UPI001B805DF0|nr:transmembrane protein 223 [Onychostruthus taczanowskii]
MAARAALDAAVAAASRDVVLYEHDRSRFFRLVGLFCAGQGLLWAYLARFAFTALRPVPAPGAGTDDPLRPRDNKWRFGFTASCLTVGNERAGALTGARGDLGGSHRGSGGGRRTLTVPLRDVSGRAHRRQAGTGTVPLKVRGRPLFFLVDTAGTMREPRLFDVTVGAFRF